jgi:pimeloyl-ACP methyl ester carboxylesterase
MFPAADYVQLGDCGHLPMWDDPELVSRTILEVTREPGDLAPPAAVVSPPA